MFSDPPYMYMCTCGINVKDYDFSRLVFCFTISAPSDPLNLVVSLNRSALTVTWDTPLMPNGVLSYLINISSLDLATGNPAQVETSLSRSDDGNRQVVLDITFEAFVMYTVRLQARTGGGVSGVVTERLTSDETGTLGSAFIQNTRSRSSEESSRYILT